MLLTVEELREHVPAPSLEDAALLRLLESAEMAIDAFIGPMGTATELFGGHGRFITLRHPAASVTSITETWSTSTTVLSSTGVETDDYLLHPGGYVIERLRNGTNGRWHWWGRVTVTYVPREDVAERVRVAIALIELDINHESGVVQETIGSWSEQKGANSVWNYQIERDSILGSLRPDAGMVVV